MNDKKMLNDIQHSNMRVAQTVDPNIAYLFSQKSIHDNLFGFLIKLHISCSQNNKVHMTQEEIAKTIDFTIQTVNKNIKLLTEKGLIAKVREESEIGKYNNVLYINPNLFFHGEDITDLPLEVILKFQEIEKENELLKGFPYKIHEDIEIVYYN